MMMTNIVHDVRSAPGHRKPSRAIRKMLISYSEHAVFDVLDRLLGDLPDGRQIRKTAQALNLSDSRLRRMAESSHESVRRISRLILQKNITGIPDDPLLQKGLSDKSPVIRSDTARFTGTGVDRTRLYNHLIKMIREDPDIRVRRSAGKRLADSFADMYSVDFSGLPPLAQMLAIDSLEGHSRIDEKRIELLLYSEHGETAFRAARTLLRWGSLQRLFNQKDEHRDNALLERAASLGVVDYLDTTVIDSTNRVFAEKLACLAGRDDFSRSLKGEQDRVKKYVQKSAPVCCDIEKTIGELFLMDAKKRSIRIQTLLLKNQDYRQCVESAFPDWKVDATSTVLFDMARSGHWKNWSERIINGLESGDSDIIISAIPALTELNPQKALLVLPSMLSSPLGRIRTAAARALASMPFWEGIKELVVFLMDEPMADEYFDAVCTGIHAAGGTALARCILGHPVASIPPAVAGRLLNYGVSEQNMKYLADGIPDTEKLTILLKHTGYNGGRSILSVLPALEERVRKRFILSMAASQWAKNIPRGNYSELSHVLMNLNGDERRCLMLPALTDADGKHRRYITKLIRS